MGSITIFDVAKKAGVSKSTVSRVLNGKGNVNEDTRKKILKVMKELNYYPNSAARSLVTKKTHTIGLVVPDITDPYFLDFIKGAEEVGVQNNYNMMLVSSNWHVNEEWRYMKLLEEDRVDGILLISGRSIPDSYIDFLKNDKTPIVIIDRVIEGNIIPTINVDNYTGAYRATKYLLENGHKKIALVMGPDDMQAALYRKAGFLDAMFEHNIANPDKLIFAGDFSEKSGYQAAGKILDDRSGITAIFFSNDSMAIGGIKYLKEKNILVPEDISIIGCDNIRELSYVEPALTTLSQPRYKMGYRGMELLINIIQNTEEEHGESKNILYELELIERDSIKEII